MARRKFGSYTVEIRKNLVKDRSDGLVETKATISGDIEIGINIDPYTWRADWLAEQMFGKDAASSYRLLNVENHWVGNSDVINYVTAVWDKR